MSDDKHKYTKTPFLWFTLDGRRPDHIVLRLHAFSIKQDDDGVPKILGIQVRATPDRPRLPLICTTEAGKVIDGGSSMSREQVEELHRQLGEWLASTAPAAPHPRIVCLCGSTRFYSAFVQANYEETMAGHIVLSVGFARETAEAREAVRYKHAGEDIGCTPAQKLALDELHKRKIDLADEVLVLNVGGYVGESTRSEIAYAKRTGKPVRWLETLAEASQL